MECAEELLKDEGHEEPWKNFSGLFEASVSGELSAPSEDGVKEVQPEDSEAKESQKETKDKSAQGSVTSPSAEELDQLRKRLDDNRRSFRKLQKSQEKVKEVLGQMVGAGSLDQEKVDHVLSVMGKDYSEDIALEQEKSLTPFDRIAQKVHSVLPAARSLMSAVEDVDGLLHGFDCVWWYVMTDKERDEFIEDCEEESAEDVLKRVMSKGREGKGLWGEMKDAGNIGGLLKKKDQKIEELQRKLDKLSKKLHDESTDERRTMRIQQSGSVRPKTSLEDRMDKHSVSIWG